MTRRLHATVSLLGPTVRLVPWWHIAAGAVIAAALLLPSRGDPHLAVGAAVDAIRLAMVPLAVSVAFVIDDPTTQVANATPLPLVARRGLRVVVVTAVIAALWAGTLLLLSTAPALNNPTDTQDAAAAATADTEPQAAAAENTPGYDGEEAEPVDSLPTGMLTLEFATLAGLTLAVAAAANRRHRDAPGGIVAAPGALGAAAVAAILPAPVALFTPYAPRPVDPAEPSIDWLTWVAAHERWAVVAAAGLITLGLALRDPARRLVPRAHPVRSVDIDAPSREPAATTSRSN